MSENDFTTNTKPKEKKCFSKRFRYLLNCTIILTGLIACIGVGYIISVFIDKPSGDSDWTVLISNILFFISMLCCNICCLEIKSTQKLFSKRLAFFIHLIGIFQIVASAVHPLLGRNTGFTLLVFFDGNTFTIGLLIFLFGSLLKEAYSMQNEIDEIL